MSPIDFPDLLEERGSSSTNKKQKSTATTAAATTAEDRGRSKGSSLIANLRSRSRSRTHRERRSASAQRHRSASCQPTIRNNDHNDNDDDALKIKKRRSLSTRASRNHHHHHNHHNEVEEEEPKQRSRSSSKHKTKSSSSSSLTSQEKQKQQQRASSRSRSKTTSPAKRRPSSGQRPLSPSPPMMTTTPTRSPKKRDWGADIINLVDVEDTAEDDDYLLSQLLQDNQSNAALAAAKTKHQQQQQMQAAAAANDRSKAALVAQRKSSKDHDKYAATTTTTTLGGSSSNHSPKSVSRFPEAGAKGRYSENEESSDDDEEDSEEEDSDDDDEDANSVATNDLLEQVNARMEQQRLMEEVKELRRVIEKKNAEIEQLTGQLRMAISTKCDLVIAHTELERLHERDLMEREQYAEQMKRSNIALMELRADIEKEFMNELTELSKRVEYAEDRRVKDVQEKEQIIHLLEDKIRRMERNALQPTSARPETDKVKFYKKKLGVYDDE